MTRILTAVCVLLIVLTIGSATSNSGPSRNSVVEQRPTSLRELINGLDNKEVNVVSQDGSVRMSGTLFRGPDNLEYVWIMSSRDTPNETVDYVPYSSILMARKGPRTKYTVYLK